MQHENRGPSMTESLQSRLRLPSPLLLEAAGWRLLQCGTIAAPVAGGPGHDTSSAGAGAGGPGGPSRDRPVRGRRPVGGARPQGPARRATSPRRHPAVAPTTTPGRSGTARPRSGRPTTPPASASATACTPRRIPTTATRWACAWPPGLLGKGLATDCMLCHGGSILGKSYVGLGNSSLDFQALFEELAEAAGMPKQVAARLLQRPRHQRGRRHGGLLLGLPRARPEAAHAAPRPRTCTTTCARTCRPGGC